MLKCDVLDLNYYFKRVGYCGSLTPSLESLNDLCWCHVQNIPWENLDMFGGPIKDLNLNRIYNDLIVHKRGGWCYEHNGLFACVLQAMGFFLVLLEGSCYMSTPDRFSSLYDHLLIKVKIDKQFYIVDVGSGINSFSEPMLFNFEPQKQMTGIYKFRLAQENEYFVERQRKKSINAITKEVASTPVVSSKFSTNQDWELLSNFRDIPRQWKDFTQACYDHQEDKDGFFTKNSFLEIFHPKGIDVLWGTTLIERIFPDPLTEVIKEVNLLPQVDPLNASPDQKQTIHNLMKDRFGIELDFWPQFISKNYHSIF